MKHPPLQKRGIFFRDVGVGAVSASEITAACADYQASATRIGMVKGD
jgi:hypothetical protein